jgi:hypothetical protein
MATEIKFDLDFRDDSFEAHNRLFVTVEKDGEQVLDKNFRCIAGGGMIEHPLFNAKHILEEEYTTLLKCSLDLRWIVGVQTEEGYGIDIRDLNDESTRYLDEPVAVPPEEILSSLIDFARRYVDHRTEMTSGNTCIITRIEVGIEDAQRRLAYQREHGTQEGYQPTISREHLRAVITECRHQDRLTEFVQQTDALDSFVADLTQSTDNEAVKEWYEQCLLFRHPEIPSETAKALARNPDERAREVLLQTRWKDQAEVMPHVFEALVELGGDDVRDTLLDTIGFTNKEPIRVAAVECLSAFDDAEVRQRLQEVAEDEEKSEEVRQAARESLAELSD